MKSKNSHQRKVIPLILMGKKLILTAIKVSLGPWGNDGELDKKGELITGGLLQWTQDGTQIEMDSTRISKEMMLEIARSMKVVEL
ncbi:hypothetical protein [Sutcliffiella horikoshii]|uniref:hypothetical protein n=1 Tax=Sutcliffiella horikoshii TaxID=79883 RepID=UPI001F229BD0|nr:hypothetical protein [Sutcliffiella horikoshii]